MALVLEASRTLLKEELRGAQIFSEFRASALGEANGAGSRAARGAYRREARGDEVAGAGQRELAGGSLTPARVCGMT